MAAPTRLLVISPWYEPGYKAGGVVRAVVNMVDALADSIDISIVTSDRDLTDEQPYPGIEVDRWIERGGHRIFHLSHGPSSYLHMGRIVRGGDWQVVHISGIFDPLFTMWPLAAVRSIAARRRPRVIVQAHGMLGEGALRIKQRKKDLFLGAARRVGLYRDVTWHATSPLETAEVRSVFGEDVAVAEAANLPDPPAADPPGPRGKRPGQARFCFFSRISPKKGLLEALRFFRRSVAGAGVVFDVLGPVDDAAYWQSCQPEIEALRRRGVGVTHRGPIERDQVHAALSGYHVMVLPTHNENFGYVILEALLAGCPVILSDQTPWLDLAEHGVGWTIPLRDETGFARAIDECIAMPGDEYDRRSAAAHRYAIAAATHPRGRDQILAMLAGARQPAP